MDRAARMEVKCFRTAPNLVESRRAAGVLDQKREKNFEACEPGVD